MACMFMVSCRMLVLPSGVTAGDCSTGMIPMITMIRCHFRVVLCCMATMRGGMLVIT